MSTATAIILAAAVPWLCAALWACVSLLGQAFYMRRVDNGGRSTAPVATFGPWAEHDPRCGCGVCR